MTVNVGNPVQNRADFRRVNPGFAMNTALLVMPAMLAFADERQRIVDGGVVRGVSVSKTDPVGVVQDAGALEI